MVYNNSKLFCNINVPSTFLSQGYIEIELESPVVTAAVDVITSTPLKPFYMTFVRLKAVGATAVARDKVATVGRRRSFIRRHLFVPAGANNNWAWSAAPREHPG